MFVSDFLIKQINTILFFPLFFGVRFTTTVVWHIMIPLESHISIDVTASYCILYRDCQMLTICIIHLPVDGEGINYLYSLGSVRILLD